MLNRREFLATGATWAAALPVMDHVFAASRRLTRPFAPHLGMFRHHAGNDPIDQIKFLADEGFVALEDNGLRAKPSALQSRMGTELARRHMTMGLFVAMADFSRPSFASGSPDLRCLVLREFHSVLETARRVGGRYLAVIPGKRAPGLSPALQMHHAVDTLRRCADLGERHNVTLLLEPIDLGLNASRLFLRTANQAADVCRAVGRPSCRLLFDVCQQAAAGHNVADLLAETGDVLGYVQPGQWLGSLTSDGRAKLLLSRLQRSRGEIRLGGSLALPKQTADPDGSRRSDLDMAQLLAMLDRIGYRGPLGIEHGKRLADREDERALIAAYRALDEAAQRPNPAAVAAARQRSTSS